MRQQRRTSSLCSTVLWQVGRRVCLGSLAGPILYELLSDLSFYLVCRQRPPARALQRDSGCAAGRQQLSQAPPVAAGRGAPDHSHDAVPCVRHREPEASAADSSAGLSRRQAMQATAAAALLAASPLASRPAAAADGGPLMMPPPSAQPQQASRAPRGDTVRRIGRVRRMCCGSCCMARRGRCSSTARVSGREALPVAAFLVWRGTRAL